MSLTPQNLCSWVFTEFGGHMDEVNCVSFSSDFSFMVTGSDDQRVRIFNVKTKKCTDVLKGHDGSVKSVDVSPCNKYFVSGSFDKTARIWKTADKSCMHVLTGHTKCIDAVTFSSCSLYLCTGSWDRTAALWCVQTGCHVKIFRGHGSVVQSVAFSQTHALLASGSWDFTIRVWTLNHMQNMKIVDSFLKIKRTINNNKLPEKTNQNVEITETDKKEIDRDECLTKINDNKLDRTTETDGNNDANNGVKNWKGSNENNIKYDNSLKGKENDEYFKLRTKIGKDTQSDNHSFDKGAKEVDEPYSKDIKTEAIIKDISYPETVGSGEFIELIGHTGNVHALAFSVAGMLASGSWDRSVRIWNPLTGSCIRIFLGHTGWVQAVNFSPEGSYCASAADDETVKVWDIVSGECVNTLEGCTYLAHYCAFTSNGNLIVSGASSPPIQKQQGEVDLEKNVAEKLKAMLFW